MGASAPAPCYPEIVYFCPMRILHFGMDYDGTVFAGIQEAGAGVLYAGPTKLLQWLENQLGLAGYPSKTDYLRIELYRQALQQHLDAHRETPFYTASFQADRFATAAVLLDWRDQLVLAGWNFSVADTRCPARLATLGQVEALYSQKLADPVLGVQAFGVADRFRLVWEALAEVPLPTFTVLLHEPLALLPPHLQRIFAGFAQKGITIAPYSAPAQTDTATNLQWLQARLQGMVAGKRAACADDTLLVLRTRRDSDAATFLAQLLAQRRDLRPVVLIPDQARLLELALLQEQQPAMGLSSASLARPSLQALRLAHIFLWEPVDVFKIMEFVTLPIKPLDDGLALEIGRALAAKPGLFHDLWFAAVYNYLENATVNDSVRAQYEFWFNRRRYRTDETAPKRDAIHIYAYLQRWARTHFEETGLKNNSLLVLAEQARQVEELLEALPEARLSYLELERIVHTIYEATPAQLASAEAGGLRWFSQAGAIAAPADTVLWWNCVHTPYTPVVEIWQPLERNWLAAHGVEPYSARTHSNLRLWQQMRPVLMAERKLWLVVPEQVEGNASEMPPLFGDIEAAFTDAHRLVFRLESAADQARLAQWLFFPNRAAVSQRVQRAPSAHLQLQHGVALGAEPETPTSLEMLLYYPHRWFFRQQLRLYPASLLSVTDGNALLGNLAHRFLEELLPQNCLSWSKRQVFDWVEARAPDLLEREGATLLLYGREPERQVFLHQVKTAAWSLISMLRANGWSVLHTEHPLEGTFAGFPVRGKADLVLQRDHEQAIIDLKWSGTQFRKDMLKNGEDLQLALYAKLLPPEHELPHTAYFILREGKMIARNTVAFREAMIAGTAEDHAAALRRILMRMEQTLQWRLEQLGNGLLEIRTAQTAATLEDYYGAELLTLLEMKTDDARWDDYRTILACLNGF